MTLTRMLPWLTAGLVCAAATLPARAADAPPAQSPPPQRSAEAVKARQEADRQRLVAKLRSEAPKTEEKPAKSTVLDLPIFHRHDRP